MSAKINIAKNLLYNLYRKRKLSTYKIAQRLGYSSSCIYNNLKRQQIPIISNSQRYKGRPGRPHTEESRKKISIAKLGDKNPAKRLEVRMKISKANKGRRFSKKTRENMSKAQKGRIISWGDKLSEAKKKWYASEEGQNFIKRLKQRLGSNNPMYNKSGKIKRRHWTRLWDESKKEELISRFRENRMRQKFPIKSTKIEKMLKSELAKRNIKFINHHSILNVCQPDITILKYKLTIQCDGDWWHANPKIYDYSTLSKIQRQNLERDIRQDRLLRSKGWHIMRFWGSEIEENVFKCVDKIEKFLKQKGKKVT